MLLKPCGRCRVLIPYGKSYCDVCESIVAEQQERYKRERAKQYNKRYNKTRDPKYVRFYNSKDWRVLSKTRLQYDNYKCVKCGKIASEVDHIIPIQTDKGWELRLDFNNTQSLCIDCHNDKHKRFKRKTPKRA